MITNPRVHFLSNLPKPLANLQSSSVSRQSLTAMARGAKHATDIQRNAMPHHHADVEVSDRKRQPKSNPQPNEPDEIATPQRTGFSSFISCLPTCWTTTELICPTRTWLSVSVADKDDFS